MTYVSSLGLMTQSVNQIQNVQLQLSNLSQQLATGKRSLDLADFTLTESNRILNLRTVATKKSSFVESIKAVEPQVNLYQITLDSMGKIGDEALALVKQINDPNQAGQAAADAQFQGMIDQVQYYLNQKLGDRYVFGGARYGEIPVGEINNLTAPTNTTITTDPVLPDYDVDAPGSDASTYVKSNVTIDEGYNLSYGISSNDPAFQRMILGLRWAYQATQTTNTADYNTAITNATDLITQGIQDIRSLHGKVAADLAQLSTTKNLHNDFIATANGQIDDIQKVDTAEVATQISFAQAQLQASYSVTAKIASLSLANFLS